MKWEHAVDQRKSQDGMEDLQPFLDERSRGGWELVAVQHVPYSSRTLYFFKRPASES